MYARKSRRLLAFSLRKKRLGHTPRQRLRLGFFRQLLNRACQLHLVTEASPSKSHPKEETPLGKIDVNTATEKELTTVPGIGHVMAARIIAARPFRSADDLKRVSGIGDKKYAKIRPYFN